MRDCRAPLAPGRLTADRKNYHIIGKGAPIAVTATDASDPGEAITADDKREYARLRSLLINPASVEVLHSGGGERVWMTDRFVMIDITDSRALREDMPDGEYRLMASRGFQFSQRGPLVNMAVYLAKMRSLAWHPAYATQWSVTDSQAKAMLLYVDLPQRRSWHEVEPARRVPLAMNEDVWQSIVTSYPGAELAHTGSRGDPFRVTTGAQVVGYVQVIPIDSQLEKTAQIIADNTAREGP